jgi:hypothetical protein
VATLAFLPSNPIVALRRSILAHGFQPVAVRTKTKRPVDDGWQRHKGDLRFIPYALSTGVSCHNLRAVDIDIDDPEKASVAIALAEETLGATSLVRFRTQSPRRLLVYRGAAPKRTIFGPSHRDESGKKIYEWKIEILGDGQQFVAYGLHPDDGLPYEWEGTSPADFPWADLPEALPEAEERFARALKEALGGDPETEAPTVQPIAPRPSGDDARPIFRQANDAALANLSAWVPSIFPGAKHQAGTGAYRVSSRQLRRSLQEDLSLAPSGITDFGVADMGDARSGRRTAIDVVMEWGSAADPVEACMWLCDRLGIEFEKRDPVPVAVVEAAAGMAAKAGAKAKSAPAEPLSSIELGRGVDWTRPKGLLADMANWILATSRRPNRPLAVAAATAVLSTVCGRHLYGPTGTSLNLYIICLAGTAVGKDRPLSAVEDILRAADLPHLHVGGDVFSVSAFEQLVIYNPCCVMTTDEIGDGLFKPILSKKANQHEAKIKPALLKLWTRNINKGPYLTIGKAGQKSVEVHSPSISILGASTPQAFFDALTAGNKNDGLMNRLLFAMGAPRAADGEPEIDSGEVPETIVRSLLGAVPRLGGNLGTAIGVFSQASAVEKRKLPWASAEVAKASSILSKSIDKAMNADPDREDLMGRIFEYSIRLASLHAVSRAIGEERMDRSTGEIIFSAAEASLELADLEWGVAWATESARIMIDKSESIMAPNEYGNDKNRVKEAIKKSGTISTRELQRKIQHLKAKDLDGIIDELIFAGVASYVQEEHVGKGRPSKKITWIG